jgi:hypothetical protein
LLFEESGKTCEGTLQHAAYFNALASDYKIYGKSQGAVTGLPLFCSAFPLFLAWDFLSLKRILNFQLILAQILHKTCEGTFQHAVYFNALGSGYKIYGTHKVPSQVLPLFFISLSFIPCLGFLKLEKNLEIFN